MIVEKSILFILPQIFWPLPAWHGRGIAHTQGVFAVSTAMGGERKLLLNSFVFGLKFVCNRCVMALKQGAGSCWVAMFPETAEGRGEKEKLPCHRRHGSLQSLRRRWRQEPYLSLPSGFDVEAGFSFPSFFLTGFSLASRVHRRVMSSGFWQASASSFTPWAGIPV